MTALKKSMGLLVRNPAKTIYHTGERLSIDGLEVLALYSDNTSEIVTDSCTFVPPVNSVLKCTKQEGVDEQSVSITYMEDGRTARTSFGITVYDTFEQIEILRTEEQPPYFVGSYFPIDGLRLKFSVNKVKTLKTDFFKYFSKTILEAVGPNTTSAAYTHVDGTRKTATLTINAEVPSIVRIDPITSNIRPTYAGKAWNFQDLSVRWVRNDHQRPGTTPEETTGVFKFSDNKFAVAPAVVESFDSREISVSLIENPEVSSTFTIGWKPRLSAMNGTTGSGIFWNKTPTANVEGWSVSSVVLDTGETVEDLASLGNITGHGEWLTFEDGKTLTLPEGVVSGLRGMAVHLSASYDDGAEQELVIQNSLSVFARLSTVGVSNPPAITSYTEGDTFDPTGLALSAVLDTGSQLPTVQYSYDETPLTLTDTSFLIRGEYPIDGLGKSTAVTTIPLKIDMGVPTNMEIVSPSAAYTGFRMGDEITGLPVTIALSLENGAVIPRLNLSDITSQDTEVYSVSPVAVSCIGNYEIELTYTRIVNGEEYTFKDTFEAAIDYTPQEENELSVFVMPDKTDYLEGEEFDTEGMNVRMKFGNGYWEDVTYSLEYPEGTAIRRNQDKVRLLYRLVRLDGSEEEYEAEIEINTTNLLTLKPRLNMGNTWYSVMRNPDFPEDRLPSIIDIEESLTEVELERLEAVEEKGFMGLSDVVVVNVPEGVSRIGASAFMGCESLVDISLDETSAVVNLSRMEKVGEMSFCGCRSIMGVVLPSQPSFSAVAQGTFMDTGLVEVLDVPDNILEIGPSAFALCKDLLEVSLVSAAISSLGRGAFSDCESLGEADFSRTSIVEVPDRCFRGCSSLTSFSFPVVLGGQCPTSAIGEAAFLGTSLESFEIPQEVVQIGASAFMACGNLHLLEIDAQSFDGTIGQDAFRFVEEDPAGVKRNILFLNMDEPAIVSLYSKLAPVGVEGYQFWTGPSESILVRSRDFLESLRYTLRIISEEDRTAEIASADEMLLDRDTVIPQYILNVEDEKTYRIVGIGEGAFMGFGTLETVVLPPDVMIVSTQSFKNCSSLVSITKSRINDSRENFVTLNGERASLMDAGSPSASFNEYNFPLVPREDEENEEEGGEEDSGEEEGSEDDGQTNPDDIEVVGDVPVLDLDEIGEEAFMGCSSLTSFTLHVIQYGKDSFKNCSGLEEVDISEAHPATEWFVEGTGYNVFDGCNSLKRVVVLNTYPLSSVFPNAGGIETAGVHGTIRTWEDPRNSEPEKDYVPSRMFAGCSSLTMVDLENRLSVFGDSVFDGCSSLTGGWFIPASFIWTDDTFFGACFGNEVYNNSSCLVFIPDIEETYTIPDNALSVARNALRGAGTVKCLVVPEIAASEAETAVLRGFSDHAVTGNPSILSIVVLATDILPEEGGGYPAGIFAGNENVTFLSSNLSMLATPEMLSGSTALTAVAFPSDTTDVGPSALAHTGIRDFDAGEWITNVGAGAFYGSTLSGFSTTAGMVDYGAEAFPQESMKIVSTPDTLTLNGNPAGLGAVFGTTVESAIVDIGGTALEDGSVNSIIDLKALSIQNCDSVLAGGLQNLLQLSSVKFMSNCRILSNMAFSNDSSLSSISLSGVLSVGENCFAGCTSLSGIELVGNIPVFTDKTSGSDTTAFDTGRTDTLSVFANGMYIRDWQNNLKARVSESIPDGFPTTWARQDGRKPSNIAFCVKNMDVADLGVTFIVFPTGVRKVKLFDTGDIDHTITVFDRIDTTSTKAKDELPAAKAGSTNPGTNVVELASQSALGNIVTID